MHKDFKTPQDLYRASSEQVERCLARLLRQGFESRPFLYRVQFQYQGGRKAPLLYIGTLNRAWRDYINENARANDLATGTCETGRGATGRLLIELNVTGGRGKRDACLAELNRTLRYLNAEVRFADAAKPASNATPPQPGDLSPDAAETAALAPQPPALDLNAELKAIRDDFEAFKRDATSDALKGLTARVGTWQAALESQPELTATKGARFVEQLKRLLAEKGASFVAKRRG